ncbi:SDR family NAD(P)-dependent oxidoreductase [Arthrobacter sedimenti]|uniref:SDR family NAD(P)-dependent oxidoreductase n=1 Tax=Arthrobacter sedimenti TaxID=2694931 RepID=UPI000B3630AB|nr:SDR family NAD(P)-dependent oxidoreductase [Arthrobacter sedimenti]OUM44015.1 3-oxoacyl-ACP reductase [Arthrobacter agilis]
MQQRFDGKVVIVTGAGSGIGEATARRFVAEGARVVLTDSVPDKIDAVVASLPEGRVTAVPADSSDFGQVEAMVQDTVERYGRLDVLVNNAGTITQGTVQDTSVDDWHRVIETDLSGVFYGTKAALGHLLETRGCIVNVSSVSGLAGDWRMSAYNAAKGGVSNFTRAVALDHGRDGVRVNAVAPGFIWTDLTSDDGGAHELSDEFSRRIALGRGGLPEEVAAAILFLASEDARFITGVVLPVDGGTMASNGQPAQA